MRDATVVPEISVLMPVYNAMPHLPLAVESILGQGFGGFEFLALDDASTDGSGAYLDGLTDPRVRVLHLPKQGLTRLLNRGLAEARGEYIARMDSDDIASPHRFSVQRAHLEAHRDVVAVGCQAEEIDGAGATTGIWQFQTDDLMIRYDLFRNVTPLVHPGVMMRTSEVRAAGGYDPDFEAAQDRDLWWKLAARGRLANSAETLLRYRRHAQSVTSSRTESQLRAVRRINVRHMRSLGVLEHEAEYDAFVGVAARVAAWSAEAPDAREVAAYARVLGCVLDHLGAVCDGAVDRIRRQVWDAASWWAARQIGRRDWRAWLQALHRLSPPPRSLRLARWAVRTAGRRAIGR